MRRRTWPRECGDVGLPHGLLYARRYVTGWRCDRHTPNALRGLPEPPPGPGWPPGSYLNHPDRTADQPPEEQDPPS